MISCMKVLTKILAGAATLISVVLLIVVIAFSDKIAGIFPRKEYPPTISQTENSEVSSAAGIKVDSEEIIYNGSTPFIIMNGVTATDVDGSDLSSEVSAVVTDGNLPTKKIIKYQVYDSDGNQWTAERQLTLEDYDGPILEVEDDMTLHSENLEELVDYLSSQDSIKAENGYGESILSNVTFEISKGEESGYYYLKFEVYNEFNDSASAEVSAFIMDMTDGPVVVLSTHSITLHAGDVFNRGDYIAFANDPEDGDLSSNIRTEGNVDTNKPGVYAVTYTAVDSDGHQANTETLTVTVEE